MFFRFNVDDIAGDEQEDVYYLRRSQELFLIVEKKKKEPRKEGVSLDKEFPQNNDKDVPEGRKY